MRVGRAVHRRRRQPGDGPLPDAPGRNLAVLGPGVRDATRVLGAAAASLGLHHCDDSDFRVVLSTLVADAEVSAAANRLANRLGGSVTRVQREALQQCVVDLARDVDARLDGGPRPPTLLVLYGADGVDTLLDRAGTEALKKVLHFGPETGVHVLGWWRSVQRLRALLTIPAAADDIGSWVALDVQGGELNALTPGLMVSWSPRPARGLFYDRVQHARPVTVIVPRWSGRWSRRERGHGSNGDEDGGGGPLTEYPEMPAAQRYKDVVADLSAAACDLRERDRQRSAELARRLVDLDTEIGPGRGPRHALPDRSRDGVGERPRRPLAGVVDGLAAATGCRSVGRLDPPGRPRPGGRAGSGRVAGRRPTPVLAPLLAGRPARDRLVLFVVRVVTRQEAGHPLDGVLERRVEVDEVRSRSASHSTLSFSLAPALQQFLDASVGRSTSVLQPSDANALSMMSACSTSWTFDDPGAGAAMRRRDTRVRPESRSGSFSGSSSPK